MSVKFHQMSVLAFVLFLVASYFLGYTPIALGVIFFVSSVIAYWLYAKDKAAAKAGFWRVPENTLHLAALSFGWPGALIAQARLRHKTKKQSFRVFFWFTVLVNLSGVAWLHSSQGNHLLRQGAYHLENIVITNVSQKSSVSSVLFLTRFRTKGSEWLR